MGPSVADQRLNCVQFDGSGEGFRGEPLGGERIESDRRNSLYVPDSSLRKFLAGCDSTTIVVLVAIFLLFCEADSSSASEARLVRRAEKHTERSHTTIVGSDERILFDDRFDGHNLEPDYQIYDGPGHYELAPSGFRYYAETRGVEMAHQSPVLNVDYLGRVYAPSLQIARSFFGTSWTMETEVTFHGFQDGTTGSGRTICLWLVFGSPTERNDHSVMIDRYNDNPGNPLKTGNLGVGSQGTIANQGGNVLPLNNVDRYFWRIMRIARTVDVWLSHDGNSYQRVYSASFGSEIDGKPQTIVLNGTAFDPGAWAELRYLRLRCPAGSDTYLPAAPSLFKKDGMTSVPIKIEAVSIETALAQGVDIEIENAMIKGDLDLSKMRNVRSRLTLKNCTFLGQITSSWATFLKDLSFVNCTMTEPVNFLGAKFKGKCDFSSTEFRKGAIFNAAEFSRFGADFSGAVFADPSTRAWFRGCKFGGPTSFYSAAFNGGADFSKSYEASNQFAVTEFDDDVTFSDASVGADADLLFYHADFQQRVAFYGVPRRIHSMNKEGALFLQQKTASTGTLGRELSFEGARFRTIDPNREPTFPGLNAGQRLSGLIFSADDPATPQERFGPSSWTITARLNLRDAQVEQFTASNVTFEGGVDLRRASFGGGPDSVRLFNVEFRKVLIDTWPSTEVVATGQTRDALVSMFDEQDDTTLSRIAYFDLLAGSSAYDKWVSSDEHRRPASYRDYDSFRFAQPLLDVFRVMTEYGTSLARTTAMGIALVFCFTISVFALDRGRYLVRIDRPLQLKIRLGETPVAFSGDKTLPKVEPYFGERKCCRTIGQVQTIARSAYLAFLFSLNIAGKVGFGNVRLKKTPLTPVPLVFVCWAGWVLGYLWIGAILYAVTSIPALKGLVR